MYSLPALLCPLSGLKFPKWSLYLMDIGSNILKNKLLILGLQF